MVPVEECEELTTRFTQQVLNVGSQRLRGKIPSLVYHEIQRKVIGYQILKIDNRNAR